MDNTELNVEKLAAELAGNTMMDETSVNDQTYQQIVAFLKTEKMNMFRYSLTNLTSHHILTIINNDL